MKRNMIYVVVLGVLCTVASAQSAVPPLMNYQGKLTDEYGVPVSDGSYTIWFRIYTDSVGGNALWEEEQWSVPVNGGLFSVLLGSTEGVPDTVFTGPVRWLGVQVSPDPELSPRKPIVSMAYAFRSAKTDTADYALNAPRDDDWLPDTSGLHIYRPAGNVGIGMVSLESELGVAGTAEMTGFKMPTGAAEGHVLTSSYDGVGTWQTPASGSHWTVADSVLYTSNYWGITRGGAGNAVRGDSTQSHVNLGVACTTGASDSKRYCTVSGGHKNTAKSDWSTVGGGYGNQAGPYSSSGGDAATVGGGYYNRAAEWATTVGGGSNNLAYGSNATIGGGVGNEALDDDATVGGGGSNVADNIGATVAGGDQNTASGRYATIGGGNLNTASNSYSTVSGGWRNNASNSYSTVSGGRFNNATALGATVAGGYADTASGDYSFAAGYGVRVFTDANYTFAFGRDFTTSTPNAVVFHNSADPIRTGIGTPNPDTTLHVVGSIKMVDGNEAAGRVLTSDANGVGSWQTAASGGNWTVVDSVLYTNSLWGIARGGAGNNVYGDSALTHVNLGIASSTGDMHEIHSYCTVGGGRDNIAQYNYATVGGGRGNLAKGNGATVGGGQNNRVYEGSDVIAGGFNNETSGHGSCTIGGGSGNTASGWGATVGGGITNYAGDESTVGGGSYNSAHGGGTVAGGYNNTASGGFSVVGGGRQNSVGGSYATVPGGYADTATGAYSLAAGCSVKVTIDADYTFAFGRDFTTSTPNAVIFHNSVDNIKMGVGNPTPTATLDINGATGYNQVRMRTSYTPTGTADANGNVGDIAWDDDYIYVKTSAGWKRTALSAF